MIAHTKEDLENPSWEGGMLCCMCDCACGFPCVFYKTKGDYGKMFCAECVDLMAFGMLRDDYELSTGRRPKKFNLLSWEIHKVIVSFSVFVVRLSRLITMPYRRIKQRLAQRRRR